MADRPASFTSPMVRALLAGTKTQTRRKLVAGTADFGSAPRDFWDHANFRVAYSDGRPTEGMYLHVPCHRDYVEVGPPCDCDRCHEMGWEGTVHRLYPRVAVGDRLWVAEGLERAETDQGFAFKRYSADHASPLHTAAGWDWKPKVLPGRYCPKWASRLTLHVTQVRVQQLLDISNDDAMAEGIAQIVQRNGPTPGDVTLDLPGRPRWFDPLPRDVYSSLWEAIHGPGSWQANPWVIATTFEVERAHIDQARAAA